MTKRWLAMFAAVAVLSFAAACGDDDDDGGGGSSTGGGGGETGSVGVLLPDSQSSVRWETVDRPFLQKAFEAAGFKNAIVAREAPADSTWSAEDIRYSTVRWTAAHRMGYAIGPSQTDPRTGEILNADVLISREFVRGWVRDWQEMAGPDVAG